MERSACFCCLHLRDELSRIAQLTDRELDVLVRLPTGMTNRAIAHELGITERTVKAYVTRIIAKLEVSSRTRAAIVGYARLHSQPENPDGTKVQLRDAETSNHYATSQCASEHRQAPERGERPERRDH